MPSVGPNYAGAAASATLFPDPSIVWDNPAAATGPPDDSSASVQGPGNSDWLVLTTYSFAISDGATITDVQTVIRCRDDNAESPIFLVQLVKGGVGVGNEIDLTGEITDTFSDAAASGAIGAGYWNTSLSVAEANAADFGVRIRFEGISMTNTVYIDSVSITVTYTGGAVTGTRRIKLRKVG